MKTVGARAELSLLTAAPPSAGERSKRRVRSSKNPWQAPSPLLPPLNVYPVPPQLCHRLRIPDSSHCTGTVSITFVLETPLIDAKGQSRFTGAGYSTMRMTATTRLCVEAWVQEKKQQMTFILRYTFNLFFFSLWKESVPAAPRLRQLPGKTRQQETVLSIAGNQRRQRIKVNIQTNGKNPLTSGIAFPMISQAFFPIPRK